MDKVDGRDAREYIAGELMTGDGREEMLSMEGAILYFSFTNICHQSENSNPKLRSFCLAWQTPTGVWYGIYSEERTWRLEEPADRSEI